MQKKQKPKEEEKDPYKKEYSVLQNMFYVIKGMNRYMKLSIVFVVLNAIASSSMQFMWSITAKLVIDGIQSYTEFKQLLLLVLAIWGIEFSLMAGNAICTANTWWRFFAVRMGFVEERIHKVMNMSYQHLEQPKVLDYSEKASQACYNDGIQGMMYAFRSQLTNIFVIIVTMGIMFTLSPVIVVIMLGLAILQFLYTDHIRKRDKKEVWDEMAPFWRKNSYLDNTTTDFGFAKDVRLYGLKNWLMKKLHDVNMTKIDYRDHSGNLWLKNDFFGTGIFFIEEAVLYIWLIWNVINNGMTIGDFSLYLGSTRTFFSGVTSILNDISTIRGCSRKVDDFRTFLEYPDIDASPEADTGASDNNVKPNLEPQQEYEFIFENVSFKYPNSEAYALKNLNLTFKPCERLAVVGLNGAGKTTMVKLLTRLYDVSEGRILLNGIDIRTYNRESYYKAFSPIFQEVELFAFPMSENVSMLSPEYTDNKKAEEFLELAGLGEKVRSLKKGVTTELLKVLSEDGIDLSGGEKQKLALARALYKNAPVVVLDEPTSALDALAEYKLYMDFDKLIKGKTALFISHRLSSTRFCDNVAMFKAGEMVEYGTHESLLALNGEYAAMFRVQAQYYMDNESTDFNALQNSKDSTGVIDA